MKRALIVLAIVAAGLGALAVRVVVEGRRALAAGDDAMAAGRASDAIAAWESAARWYLPGALHVDEAYDRLVKLATAAAGSAGARAHQLLAWRAVRSAALATRSLWTPHAGDLEAANAAIAQRSADDPEGALASGNDNAARRAWHRAQLDRDPDPRGAAATLAVLGIAGWLIGVLWLVRRGLDDAGRPRRRALLVGLAITIAGVVAWAGGLYNA